ncbi:ATP-dependent zinc metalloprotease FtsH [Telmatocola sphagniphila]|uniref:ATP-dependent zinc metalloprotease FtsH n=1 Tax=Telmatocola sphagniphila TaxID=1123043 RepID=A0A8E6B7T4_9BACT|nr:ATP-dependent zinc metalloprotease FtsH [Telmatocola sphagniphila]QVL33705.1 ATP-dependent zinc metalloprotease FtsH [Telmatocola sphagniphila]
MAQSEKKVEEVKPSRPSPISAGLFIMLAMGFIALIAYTFFNPNYPDISIDRFYSLMEKGQLSKIRLIGTEKLIGEVRDKESEVSKELKLNDGRFSVRIPHSNDPGLLFEKIRANDLKANETALAKGEMKQVQINQSEDIANWFGSGFWSFISVLVIFGLFFFLILPRFRDSMGGPGVMGNFIKSSARRYDNENGRTTFQDVAGMDNAKQELQEVVEFLKAPEKFLKLGAQIPKGVLLVGPPGTGKTLLARAVAGEAGVPFFSINGSEFIQMFVGVGASRVRDLFRTAKENAPCLIFIDEIDAVGRMRGAGVGGGSDEREQTLNQILSEMDGFQPNETIIVVAATNRPDVLDAALLRPGRFDRHVTVDRPTWQGRLQILKVHTRNKPLADEVDLEAVARKTIGMSGAELKNLANEAAILASRDARLTILQKHFNLAYDRVLMGPKRDEKFSEVERKRTAYHEAGHALCAIFEPKADPLSRVSIVPRGKSGGVTISNPDEEKVDYSESELQARLVMTMGGRAADRLIFGEASSGAIQDLKQATRIARMMVTQFGMSEKLGPVSYRAGEEHVFLGKELMESRDFSEGTARLIDEEVQRLLRDADHRAYDLLVKHRSELEKLTEALLTHEELESNEVHALLGLKKKTSDKPDETVAAPPQLIIGTV